MAKRKPTAAGSAAARVLMGERGRLGALPKDRSVPVSLRLSPAVKARIDSYFRARGMTTSHGLRAWILEQMEQEGLR